MRKKRRKICGIKETVDMRTGLTMGEGKSKKEFIN